MFGDGHRDAGDVGFLEGIFAQHGTTDLATDCQHRRAVHPGIGNWGHQISGTRAACADTDTNATS